MLKERLGSDMLKATQNAFKLLLKQPSRGVPSNRCCAKLPKSLKNTCEGVHLLLKL